MPLNAGQVIKQFAISNGISLEKFSSNEYLRRVRRSKKKLHTDYQFQLHVRQKFSKKIIKRNIQCKKFYIGEEVVPKCYKTNYIDQDVNCKKN